MEMQRPKEFPGVTGTYTLKTPSGDEGRARCQALHSHTGAPKLLRTERAAPKQIEYATSRFGCVRSPVGGCELAARAEVEWKPHGRHLRPRRLVCGKLGLILCMQTLQSPILNHNFDTA